MEEKKIGKLDEICEKIKKFREDDSRLSFVWSGSGKVVLTRRGEPRSPICTLNAEWDNETLLVDLIALVSALSLVAVFISSVRRLFGFFR